MCVLQSTGVDKLAVAGLASAAECVLPAQVWLLAQCQTVTNCLSDAQALTPSGCRCVRSPFDDMPAINEYVLSAIFLVDMILKFRLAYRKNEQLIGDPSTIRTRYLRCESATPSAYRLKPAWALDYFQMFRMLRLVSDPEASPPQSPSTTAAMLEIV